MRIKLIQRSDFYEIFNIDRIICNKFLISSNRLILCYGKLMKHDKDQIFLMYYFERSQMFLNNFSSLCNTIVNNKSIKIVSKF